MRWSWLGLLPLSTATLLPPAWSVALELRFYLITLVVLRAARSGAGLLGLGLTFWLGQRYGALIQNPFTTLLMLAAGAAADPRSCDRTAPICRAAGHRTRQAFDPKAAWQMTDLSTGTQSVVHLLPDKMGGIFSLHDNLIRTRPAGWDASTRCSVP